MSVAERSLYLIGDEITELPKFQLPSVRQVLSLYNYKQRTSHTQSTFREVAGDVIDEVYLRWSEVKVPVRKKQSSIDILSKFHTQWKMVMKNKSRSNSAAQKSREEEFSQQLDDLFNTKKHDFNVSLERLRELMKSPHDKGIMHVIYTCNGVQFSTLGISNKYLIHFIAWSQSSNNDDSHQLSQEIFEENMETVTETASQLGNLVKRPS